tara:strand:- start:7897 stop:9384 length:1488 start_codon:yes stop_codon:yes gene_type:complete
MNLADIGRMLPNSASKLENFIPTRQGAKVRGGNAKHGTIGSDPVKALFTYQSGVTEELFAADDSGIYEVTSFADPDVAPTAAVGSLTSGYWTFVQVETTGGDFLVGVNGSDAPQEYDGSTWSNSSLSGSGLTVANLSHVWSFKSRLFFIEDGSMKAWYLGVGAKSGSLTSLSFAAIFQRGGSLLMGGTWSLDAGDGVDDLCVFISTLGEVAIYQGTDPASDWSIVGRYDIAPPLGKNAWMKAGGDLVIATEDGLVPISQAISKDREALKLVSVSDRIEPTWLDEVKDRGGLPWDIVRWDRENLAYVCMPSPGSSVEGRAYVVHQLTGAWAPLTMDMHCGAVLNGQMYWGDGSGTIYQAQNGGSDNGSLYTCDYVGPFINPTGGSSTNTAQWFRATFRASNNFVPKVTVETDYSIDSEAAPASPDNVSEGVWDSGLWDTVTWDALGAANVRIRWRSVTGEGDTLAPRILMSFGVTFPPDAEIIKCQMRGYKGADVI